MGWQRGPSLPEAARGQLCGQRGWRAKVGAAAPELRGALLGPSPLFVAMEPVLGERPGAAEEENPCPVARSWLPSDGARGGHRVCGCRVPVGLGR